MIDWKASADRPAEECVPVSILDLTCAYCGAKLDGTFRHFHPGRITEFTFEAINTKPMKWEEVVSEWPTENPPGKPEDWPPMKVVGESPHYGLERSLVVTTFRGSRSNPPHRGD